ncbi:MAG: transcriptional repressor [Gaiellales bacterium]|nr:transcriptional repressor [Gaiellales bacterium]
MTHHATRTLQELGYRLTPQRTMVWEVLRRTRGAHLSAEDVCAQVQADFPHVNLSTVYRTLELLVGLKLVRETCLGSDRRYYEVEEEVPHHHVVCGLCGKVEHLSDDSLQTTRHLLNHVLGFEMREATFFGVCRTCLSAVNEGEEEHHAHP